MRSNTEIEIRKVRKQLKISTLKEAEKVVLRDNLAHLKTIIKEARI